MNQKIAIKVQMNCDKCRSKAMKLVASAEGVNSIELQGEDQLVIVGDGADPVYLTTILRKKFGRADITKVEEVKKSGEKEKEKEKEKPKVELFQWYPNQYYTTSQWYPNNSSCSQVVAYDDSGSYSDTSSCSIM
ncbi:heavy metal-associated isoprenylated plant protein 47-like [Typha latifolia]|uniref:heavy metal-associated isoprenylated plant protein 47-like n=1 Tax=Typha latifolia TaxID=4733 RepID=UPI003C2D0530